MILLVSGSAIGSVKRILLTWFGSQAEGVVFGAEEEGEVAVRRIPCAWSLKIWGDTWAYYRRNQDWIPQGYSYAHA